MKILLISGHGSGDAGACGQNLKEADLTRIFTTNIKSMLTKLYKVTVDIYPVSHNAYEDVKNGNFAMNIKNYDYVLEVHMNGFSNANAHGVEVLYPTIEKQVDKLMLKNLSKYFSPRGNKKRTDLAVMNYITTKKVITSLVEVFFVTSPRDVATYNKNKSSICLEIVKAIASAYKLKAKVSSATKRRKVTIKRIYKSANSLVGKKPVYTTVYIKKYLRGTKNPYLVSNGKGEDLGWVRGVYKA